MADKFLTKEQELECGRHIQAMLKAKQQLPTIKDSQQQDALMATIKTGEQFLTKLVQANKRLVYREARAYKAKFISAGDIEDIIQEGFEGLLKAAYKYDPAKGNKFSTMAIPWIYQAINRNCTKVAHVVRIPESRVQQYSKFVKLVEAYEKEMPYEKAKSKACDHLNLHKTAYHKIVNAIIQPVSLDTPIDDSENRRVADLLDMSPGVEDTINLMSKDKLHLELYHILNELNGIEKDVMSIKYGDLFGLPRRANTVATVAKMYKVSPYKIKRVEQQVLIKIRQKLEKFYY